jgi:hypothetical protein
MKEAGQEINVTLTFSEDIYPHYFAQMIRYQERTGMPNISTALMHALEAQNRLLDLKDAGHETFRFARPSIVDRILDRVVSRQSSHRV